MKRYSARLLIHAVLAIPPLLAATPGHALLVVSTHTEEEAGLLLQTFQQSHPKLSVTVLDRRIDQIKPAIESGSLHHADLVLTSSALLLQSLKQAGLLATLPPMKISGDCAPKGLLLSDPDRYFASYGLAGFGLLWHQPRLTQQRASTPDRWADLLAANMHGGFVMSTPTRSGSTHILIEQVLQEQGWDKGWARLLRLAGNQTTIASRSYSVSRLVADGEATAGPLLDNTASQQLRTNPDLRFRYLPSFPVLPAYVAILKNGSKPGEARDVARYLFSQQGQADLLNASRFKFPLNPGTLSADDQKTCQLMRLQQPLDDALVQRRARLVKQLYETLVTQNFEQLRDTWGLILHVGRQTGLNPQQQQQLARAEKLASSPPVPAFRATDPAYLAIFNAPDPAAANKEAARWQRDWHARLTEAASLARRVLVNLPDE
ncbi:ABC transporter substrate-binding protein [Jeongeupia wiesaeckerbachi]|uniref:ABC transporter substrate-binding protein n=1 Tax=Jeongeupia wiesaeckerbachi TaxID=3051218 RepID=UPI003D805122